MLNLDKKNQPTTEQTLTVLHRQEHGISRKDISDNALKVLYRLKKSGYSAYLVGGGVRDLLLNQQPKDFDIATNATPEQIQKLFRNCRLVGRRFRLAHIMFGRDTIEVATFRGHHDNESKTPSSSQSNQGMLLRDNVYGSIEEDAVRRDFTINALYYDISDFSVRDYVNGLADLDDGIIRLIGDPETRYREDPVRMLRAIRFSAKLDMTICEETAAPIEALIPLLRNIPSARLFEESLKLLQSGYGVETYHLLREFNLFPALFPLLAEYFTEHQDSQCEQMIEQVLASTDHRILNNMRVHPAFMFAAMLWYPLEIRTEEIRSESGLSYVESFMLAANDVLDEQVKSTAIPKRFTGVIRDIWQLQLRLPKRNGSRALKLLEQPKFRAAFDLLAMRAKIEGGEIQTLTSWWESFQYANHDERHRMILNINKSDAQKNRRRKKSFQHRKPYSGK